MRSEITRKVVKILEEVPHGVTAEELSVALYGGSNQGARGRTRTAVKTAREESNTPNVKIVSLFRDGEYRYKRTRDAGEIREWQQRYSRDTESRATMISNNVHKDDLKVIASELLTVATKLVEALS